MSHCAISVLLRTTADYRPVNSASISVQFWLQLGCDFVGICWGFWLGGKCNFEAYLIAIGLLFDCEWDGAAPCMWITVNFLIIYNTDKIIFVFKKTNEIIVLN